VTEIEIGYQLNQTNKQTAINTASLACLLIIFWLT